MPSTYSSRLRIELIADGEQAGTWGSRTNVNLGTLLESAIAGYRSIAMPDTNYTLTTSNGGDDDARYAMLNFVGTLTATRDVIVPAVSKLYVVRNQTNQALNVKTASGSARSVPLGKIAYLLVDGTDTIDSVDHLTSLTVSGTTSLAALNVSGAVSLASSLGVTGATSLGVTSATNLSYTGTFTGGTGVFNIGSGQVYKDSSGNVGIGGIPSGSFKFDISTTGSHFALVYPSVATWGELVDPSGNRKWFKDGSEKFRISLNGFSKFSNNGSFITGVLDRHEFNSSLDSSLCTFYSSNTGSSVIVVEPALPAGATGTHIACQLNNVRVMQVLANGNVQNTNNSYGAISDARLKENVSPAKSYLERFMRVQYKTFNFIGSEAKQFGVIAQELEEVFPGLVEEAPIFDEDGRDTGGTQKTVKYSVLAQIQGKVIQEQQHIIQSLESRFTALEDLVLSMQAQKD